MLKYTKARKRCPLTGLCDIASARALEISRSGQDEVPVDRAL
jgi:hypothetical protein